MVVLYKLYAAEPAPEMLFTAPHVEIQSVVFFHPIYVLKISVMWGRDEKGRFITLKLNRAANLAENFTPNSPVDFSLVSVLTILACLGFFCHWHHSVCRSPSAVIGTLCHCFESRCCQEETRNK